MRTTPLTLLACCLALAACNGDAADDADIAPIEDTAPTAAPGEADTTMPGMADAAGTATATLVDTAGTELGVLTLTETGEVIDVAGTLTGLPPGTHALHLHQTGQCEPAFDAAGGHWNPTNAEHGTENPAGPHLGDLPNFDVAEDGNVSIQASTPEGASLRGTNALLDADGAAVVVHAGADDYRTNPSGDSGDRIACGVVEGM